jgi:hypothetical protein|tara:strand:- start:2031 stop:4070 length:2040 start_codon:yes stop_codon:yes gene_type:complete
MAGLSMLRVVSNDDMVKAEQEQVRRDMEDRQQSDLVLGLAAYVKSCWNPARIAKKPIETIMLRALRQRGGEYEADKLGQIKAQGGSQVYMMITEVKCRGAESWLRDILLDTGTPPWDLKPTPIPDLAPDQLEKLKNTFAQKVIADMQAKGVAPTVEEMAELEEVVSQDFRFAVLQEAQNRADKMKLKINDQFAQGGWGDAFNEFITDMVTYPSAFIKGPVVRRQRILGYSKAPDGSTIVEGTERLGPEYERVNPFNIYPEPGITHLNEGYVFEHHPMSRSQLSDLIDIPGYDSEAIREVLKLGNGQSWINEDTKLQEEELERKYYSYESPTENFDALEFWGKVSGKMLLEWGLSDEDVPDEAKEYDANVWVVGNFVIKALLNYDPLGEKPYVKTSFIKSPGAFWGKGIPEIIEDLQNVCNAAARSLVNNMGLASGPQVEVNLERIPPNEDITQLHPWKIWQVTNDPLGSSAPAVRFSQPDSRANELMGVYDRFSKLADDHSGVPSYVTGDLNVSGAGRTASGLSMLMGSAGKGIRQIVMYIDNDIVRPIVQRQFIYNMRYDEDESIKGDVEVLARGAINLATKETLNVRRVEFLNATANPIDIEIVGQDGRAALLREVAKGLQMPVEDIIPSREKGAQQAKSKAQMAAQQAAPTPTQPDGSPKGGADGNVVASQPTGAP